MSDHLKEVKRQLYRNLWASYRGWWQWHKVITGKGVKNTAVVLLPSCDREINYLALLYLDAMLESRKHDNAVILSHDPQVLKSASLFSPKILRVIPFSRKKAEDLMQFYCLYEFDKRFIVASLDEPNGRNGSVLIGKRGTTQEEIFVIGVYRVYPFERPPVPAYSGSDPDMPWLLRKTYGFLLCIKENGIRYSIRRVLKKAAGRLPLVTIFFTFFGRVLPGYRAYARLYNAFSCQIYMQYCASTGDVYIDCGLLKNYIRKHRLSEDYVFVVDGRAAAGVAQLFDLTRVEIVNGSKARDMIHFVRFGPRDLYVVFLHYHDLRMYTACAFQTIGLHGVNFFEQYLYSVFTGLAGEDFLLPSFSKDDWFVEDLFTRLSLVPGKTVLLAPYANTVDLKIEAPTFWGELVKRIKEAGYVVCTNSSGKNEPAIAGTVPVSIPYTYCKLFLERAGFFIGARSGLCEVISSVDCKKIIVYPDVDWPESRALKIPAQEILSVSQLPHAKDVSEFVFCQGYSHNLIDQIVRAVK